VPVELLLLTGSILILLSIVVARVSDNLGVPVLVLFLGIGMLAGSEGPGGLYFDDAALSQSIGTICLMFILFAGGLDTRWSETRPVFWPAVRLSTLGVVLTAAAVGVFTHLVLGFPLTTGLLLGAVISSTDAAAVFSVLRARSVHLRGSLKPLLEIESGSNDPMAVFLTVGLIEVIATPDKSLAGLIPLFFYQMGLGALAGFGFGRLMTLGLNRLKLPYEGMYPVYAVAFASLVYGATAAVGGSGFLAVYIAGIIAGNSSFIHKRSLVRFVDGLAWLSQIGMFLTMGLLVFPSHVVPTLGIGIAVSAFLLFAARPLSVFIALAGTRFSAREKTFISWVGLRGAVPIILATFPLLAGLQGAAEIFNVVFFIVLTSALLQGWSIPVMAKLLRVDAPPGKERLLPLEFTEPEGINAEIVDFVIPARSAVIGKPLVALGLPRDSLVVLIGRNNEYIVPSGGTIMEEGDTILALVSKENLADVRSILERKDRT
jgi:cell volume regulation protein A